MRARRCAPVVLVVLLALPQAAIAQFEPVTDTDFAIDLYTGPVLGSTRIIGMGGAAVGLAEGAAGQPFNPAAPAVRPVNANDKWEWDWNVDWLNPEIGNDFDNNGITTDDRTVGKSLIVIVGITVNYKKWAFGLNLGPRSFEVSRTNMGEEETFESSFLVSQVSISRSFWRDQLVVGLGARGGAYTLKKIAPERADLIQLEGGSIEAGAVWKPTHRNFRVGMTASGPAKTTKTIPTGCEDPMDCQGFTIPERVELPWKLAAGFAWRRADSKWHTKTKKRWRDERALLLAFDVVVTGNVDNGYGMEQYVFATELQPSGRNVDTSIRFGADYEWKPGRFRVRGGTYWEPSRFENEFGSPVAGRVHITAGFDVRVWDFDFWDDPYRLRLSLTGDGAKRYGNAAISVGLWH